MSEILDLIKRKTQSAEVPVNATLASVRRKGLNLLEEQGLPSAKHEEWKYTKIAGVLDKHFEIAGSSSVTLDDLAPIRLPGSENANELVFVNGQYHEKLSTIRSSKEVLQILSLGDAANGAYKEVIEKNLGHSSEYHPDGINAMNTAFVQDGVFIAIASDAKLAHPLFFYYINDARSGHPLSFPRTFVYVQSGAELTITEQEITLGQNPSFVNRICEMVVEERAQVYIYKIQNESGQSHCVKTTHVRQVGVSKVHSVTLTLNGGVIRNHLNFILEAPGCESHMYGLYCVKGETHVDNHTIVDNVAPHCFSNEFYKGILDGHATGVFNGKIFVRKDAQKTNAYQSNKNILIGDAATVYTKPQLEIFADDVKCSHGCTIGRLDEEALFYMQARGVGEQAAKALLLQAFAGEILEKIEFDPLRSYAQELVLNQLIES